MQHPHSTRSLTAWRDADYFFAGGSYDLTFERITVGLSYFMVVMAFSVQLAKQSTTFFSL